MKKLFVTLLAFSLIACMAFSASAAVTSVEAGSNTASQPITITLNKDAAPGATTSTVYSVDVTWNKVELTYAITSTGENAPIIKWNPETHAYETEAGVDSTVNGGWTEDTFTVTVANHSNAAVVATITPPANENGVSFAVVDAASFTLGRADEGESLNNPENAPENTFTVQASGIPASTFTVDTTVTITAAP